MVKKIDYFNKYYKNPLDKQKDMTNKGSGSKTSTVQKKKRGRRPKKIINSSSNDMGQPKENNDNQTNASVILKLKFDPKKFKLDKKSNKKNSKLTSEDKNDNLSEGMFKNDIPCDNICHKCIKNEKALSLIKSKLEKYEQKDKIDKSNKIYNNNLNFISISTGKKITIKKTNLKCWWDAHTFDNLPCFLPELYHNNTYHVIGCFCSFNCALAYNLYYLKDSKVYLRKALTYNLYRQMYDINNKEPIEIKEAPPKEILEDFGGSVNINAFRRKFIMLNREYIVFVPPIKPINIVVEERTIDTNDDNNDNDYVLKRYKPLNKKKSVISSMKKYSDSD